MKNKITIPIDELQPANDAGHRAWITCPDCGEGVHIAENPYWGTRCQCREWSLVIVAEGRLLEGNESDQIAAVSGLACKCGNQIFTHRHSNWIECTACNKIQILQA